MNPKGWFASLAPLPTIIDAPGEYITRCGETVRVTVASSTQAFACVGWYSNNVGEAWHKSGRLYFGRECNNDIVRKAC